MASWLGEEALRRQLDLVDPQLAEHLMQLAAGEQLMEGADGGGAAGTAGTEGAATPSPVQQLGLGR